MLDSSIDLAADNTVITDCDEKQQSYNGPLSPLSIDELYTFPSPSTGTVMSDEFPSIDELYTSPQPAFLQDTQFDISSTCAPLQQASPVNSPGTSPSAPFTLLNWQPYASPLSDKSPSPSSSTATDTLVHDTIEVKRRGPGRPPASARLTHPPERVVRKRLHNVSASKSRARFSASLEKLWDQIPENTRVGSMRAYDSTRPLSKADKVEIALGYMKLLQRKVNGGLLVK